MVRVSCPKIASKRPAMSNLLLKEVKGAGAKSAGRARRQKRRKKDGAAGPTESREHRQDPREFRRGESSTGRDAKQLPQMVGRMGWLAAVARSLQAVFKRS